MAAKNKIIETIYESIDYGIEKGVLHLETDWTGDKYNIVRVRGKELVNFSSYSYLGLDSHPSLKQAGIDALNRYGTQFGSSRAYISIHLYDILEQQLTEIFGYPVVVAPSTTLAHQAALPILVSDKDIVLMDQYVHSSVQTTAKMLSGRGIKTAVIRHNDLQKIEAVIQSMQGTDCRVWYLIDGIYSMHGDKAPLKELKALSDKYKNLMLYIDDAHGMSWTGDFGKGYALSTIEVNSNTIVVTSLNKAFAGAGGVLILPHNEQKKLIRTCGGPMIFSTPIPPPMLGINIASAYFHQTDEFKSLQSKLADNIQFCRNLITKYGIPSPYNMDTPVFFVAVGLPRVTINLVSKCVKHGIFVTPAIFPAVSTRKSGIRLCINAQHSHEDIEYMIDVIRTNYFQAFYEEGAEIEGVSRLFQIQLPIPTPPETPLLENITNSVSANYSSSVNDIDQEAWDLMFKGKGSFDSAGLKFLEDVFKGDVVGTDTWRFHYIRITDSNNETLVAAFLTTAMVKDDMFSPKEISEIVEIERNLNPNYMVSKAIILGSLLTEGEHLYINRDHAEIDKALAMFVKMVEDLRATEKAEAIYLRDFDASDSLLSSFFIGNGFIRTAIPNANIIHNPHLNWVEPADYLAGLSSNSRQNVKRYAIRYEEHYDTKIIREADDDRINRWYELYLNVKSKSFELNTFNLPKKFFHFALNHPNWEIIELHLKGIPAKNPVLVGFCYKSGKTYSPMIVGMDYTYQHAYKVYRQGIYQVVKRAHDLQCEKVYFGFTADIEKRNFGAEQCRKVAFIQTTDGFALDRLQALENKLESYD